MLTATTLNDLSIKQKNLDQYIEKKVTNENPTSLFKKRILAFVVEVGEYANEERAFKFWSEKQPSILAVRLEEYVDGLHFLLSLGNSLKYNFNHFQPVNSIIEVNDPIENYLQLINYLDLFVQKINDSSYTDLLTSFLNIMNIQNYSESDVLKVYEQKNKINYDRQNQGY